MRIVALDATPLSVPLREPFVIATGRMDATRAALVRIVLEDGAGRRAEGWGEAAALPPVTPEDQPELLGAVAAASPSLVGETMADLGIADAAVAAVFAGSVVARAGVASALADASGAARAGLSLGALLGADAPASSLETDITLPIGAPEHVAALAVSYRAAGFRCFKVKVGRDAHADRRALRACAAAVPDARFRLDANAGFQRARRGDPARRRHRRRPCARVLRAALRAR